MIEVSEISRNTGEIGKHIIFDPIYSINGDTLNFPDNKIYTPEGDQTDEKGNYFIMPADSVSFQRGTEDKDFSIIARVNEENEFRWYYISEDTSTEISQDSNASETTLNIGNSIFRVDCQIKIGSGTEIYDIIGADTQLDTIQISPPLTRTVSVGEKVQLRPAVVGLKGEIIFFGIIPKDPTQPIILNVKRLLEAQ
jgi:hypothetical protein